MEEKVRVAIVKSQEVIDEFKRWFMSTADKASTIFSKIEDTFSYLRTEAGVGSPKLSAVGSTVKAAADEVINSKAKETLLPKLLEKQYELITLYKELRTLMQSDPSLASRPELPELKKEMGQLMAVILKQQEPSPGDN